MESVLNVTLMILSGVLIVLILLQSGNAAGASGAFTGNGGLNLFAHTKERGGEKVLTVTTGVLCALYIGLVVVRLIVG